MYMGKIEVGEYVRTNTGLILKYDDENERAFIDNFLICPQIIKERIIKHSKIISEVVEAGDYVNGKLIHKIDKGPNYCYLYYGKGKTFVDYQIKTILTKEQYMANCYKVGGEKWD